jgi:DnaJ like chaperone protein
MGWKGLVLGALLGLAATRSLWGAVVGALIGYMIEQGAALSTQPAAARTVSAQFFRTTFEFMGYVAKSDGRVSEAEIDAARRLMHELNLGEAEVTAAISCFRRGKTPGYDAALSVEQLRQACGPRFDLLRAFLELQLRAALAGNGLSPPARAILARVAEQLGFSGIEFAHMEASMRARTQNTGAQRSNTSPLAHCYSELEVAATATDQEVTKAYRRQMSRHHPDKLVANGLPESMTQMAKEKTQRIQEAYETIRAARGMR